MDGCHTMTHLLQQMYSQYRMPTRYLLNISIHVGVLTQANRDICRDESMAEGATIPRKLTIGEAGSGHSFYSESIGAVALKVKGERLPVLSRTIFAKQIHENILSVPELLEGGCPILSGLRYRYQGGSGAPRASGQQNSPLLF